VSLLYTSFVSAFCGLQTWQSDDVATAHFLTPGWPVGATPPPASRAADFVRMPSDDSLGGGGGEAGLDLNGSNDGQMAPTRRRHALDCTAAVARFLHLHQERRPAPPRKSTTLLTFGSSLPAGAPAGGCRLQASGLTRLRRRCVTFDFTRPGE
jgi:hypothetical protein